MSFDGRDLHRGKDVFDVAGAYLGTVIWVMSKPDDRLPLSRGSERGPVGGGLPEVFSGESIGPMPTSALGNTGPSSQSPITNYATSPNRLDTMDARQPTAMVVVRLLTSLNWSTLRPRIWRIPVRLVQSVSHERIVLAVGEHDLG